MSGDLSRSPEGASVRSYRTRLLRPQSLVKTPAGLALAIACALVLIGLGISDLFTPVNVTVSAVGVFPVLAAAWFLSLRATVAIAALAVLLQIWLLTVSSIDWLTVAADVAALLLMAAIGRFAAGNWAVINAGLDREKRAQERLEAVLEVAQSILRGQRVEELMSLVASRARTISGAVIAAVAVPDSGHRTYTIRVVDGAAASNLLGLRVRASPGSSGSALRASKSVVVEDLSEGFSSDIDSHNHLGPAMLVPLAAGRHRFGTLVLANLKGSNAFSEPDRILIELFAAQAAVALEYARVRDELQRLVVVEDRARISQELHDGVIQSLYAIGLELAAASSKADAEHSLTLRRAIEEINGVIRDLRGYIYGLVPGLLHMRDLEGALIKLTEDFTNKLKIPATATIDPQVAALLTAEGMQLIQFATEALSNVARHSGSTTCSLKLARMNGHAVMEIRDEGGGFDPAEASSKGFGLQSLGDRAARLGGKVVIDSSPGHGTTVRLTIPIKRTPELSRGD